MTLPAHPSGRLAAIPALRGEARPGEGASLHRTATLTAVLTLAAAAVIHQSEVAAHTREWLVEGAFFVVLATVEIFLAVALLLSRGRAFVVAAVAISLGTVALWALSRTVGVPIGPSAWRPEGVGAPDALATALELGTAMALLPLVLPVSRSTATLAIASAIAAPVCVATAVVIRSGDGHDHDPAAAGGSGAPARAVPGAGRPDAGYFVAQTPLGPFGLQIGVGPATAGVNTIDLVVGDNLGRRPRLQDVRVSARPLRAGAAPVRLRPKRLAPGHFVVGAAVLRAPGWWRLRVEARDQDGRGEAATVMVPVGRGGS